MNSLNRLSARDVLSSCSGQYNADLPHLVREHSAAMTSRGIKLSSRRLAALRGYSSRRSYASAASTLPPVQLARSLISLPTMALNATRGPPVVAVRHSSSTPKPRSSLARDRSQSNAAPAVVAEDHLALAKPLDFDMASKVEGQESQMVSFELEPGQVIRVRFKFGNSSSSGIMSLLSSCCSWCACACACVLASCELYSRKYALGPCEMSAVWDGTC